MNSREMKAKLYKLGRSTYINVELEKEIRLLKADCQSLREPKSVIIDDMPHSKAVSDVVGSKVVKIIEIYEKRIDELILRLENDMREKDKLQYLISKLTIEEQNIIKAKYIDGLRWEYIPGRVNICLRQCYRIHKEAINKLLNLWDF